MQSWDSPSQQYWDHASQQQLQCKLSSTLGLFMGFPLSSEQKDSRKLLAIACLAPLLNANHYSKWNQFALKICSKTFCLFFPLKSLCELRSSSAHVPMAIVWNLSPMQTMELMPVFSESFHLHLSICFLPEQGHLWELFCHFLF